MGKGKRGKGKVRGDLPVVPQCACFGGPAEAELDVDVLREGKQVSINQN